MRRSIKAANDSMTNEALRVMGFAYRIEEDIPDEMTREFAEQGLIFAGLMGMIDPARPEVQPTLEKARSAGIRTIMITGDYPNTGAAVARSIGLLRPGDKVHTGAGLERDGSSPWRKRSRKPPSPAACRLSTRCAS